MKAAYFCIKHTTEALLTKPVLQWET